MLSTQSKYRGASSWGSIFTDPFRTASAAAFAIGSTFTNHCLDKRGSIVVSHLEQCPTA
ncbi:unannotated protein [freshwater metagenome]|uniref:Unannotated protein n=1 Tax=freshwater metagenome TaxID=449393 RepID=A0A6J6ES22_9ZZZZ